RTFAPPAGNHADGFNDWALVLETNTPPDTQPPSVPTNLAATAVSSSAVNLTWTASTDNVGVSFYQVYRCQGAGCTPTTQIGTPTSASFGDTGLAASTTYGYAAIAVDGSGNASAKSATVSATTPASSGGTDAATFVQIAAATPQQASQTVNVVYPQAQGS